MAVMDKSLDHKILSSAKKEFLQYGFAKANLRRICENAGVTTGAVYTRYKGKNGLFSALVQDTITALEAKIHTAKQMSPADSTIQSQRENMQFFNGEMLSLMEFLYAYYDGFRLLRCCAEGSKYFNFLHKFIEDNTDNIWEFLSSNQDKFDYTIKVDKLELHLMLTTYWSAIFEPIQHEFSKERAIHYCEIMTDFFSWQSILEKK